MFDIKPTITEQQLYSEPTIDLGTPAGMGEVFDSAVKDVWASGQVSSSINNEMDTYARHIKKVKELTGAELVNPALMDGPYVEGARKTFLDELEKLAAKHPDKRADLLPEQDFEDQARGMVRASRLKTGEAWERSDKGIAAWTASLSGSLVGGLSDPINAAAMLATPWVGAGRGLTGMAAAAAKSGAYNAAAEVAMQPFIRSYSESAGMPITLGESAVQVGAAFGLGAGLDALFRGGARGLATYRGLTPILKDDKIVGWRRPGEVDPATIAAPGTLIEPTPLDIPEDLTARAFGDGPDAVAARAEIAKRIDSTNDHLSMETVRKAESGDVTDPATIAAQRKVAEVTGEIERPDVRARIDAEETANATIRKRPTDNIDDDTHLAATKQALAYVADPVNNLPPARVLESGPATGWLRDMREKVEQLQAKVQQELSDDDRKALLMVNTMDRANADPVAAARMLREEPALMTRDLDFGETGLGQARSIATLSDEAFERVASGEYAPEIGALVADHVPEGFQIRALQDLTDRAPTSEASARAMLADMLNGPEYRAAPGESPVTLRERQMDDPYGKEAQAQVQQLESELAEELGRKAAPDPTPVEIITDAIKKADEVRSAVESMAGMLPEGVRVKTYTALSDVPDTVVADMLAANRQRFERASLAYQVADNAEARAAARLELDEALALRGVEAFVDTADANTIWLASYAMNPRGRIAHEAVHILKAQGRIVPEEMAALAAFARESRAFSPSRQASYAEAYKARGTPERVAELLDEEAVAHLIEARANGKLDPVDIPPRVLTILDRIAEFFDSIRNALMGKGFTSTAETTFSARKAQAAEIERLIQTVMNGEAAKRVATQAVMQAEDIKAMAVKPVTPAVKNEIPFDLPRYADPEGNELSFDDVRTIVDQWRYVRNEKWQTQPRSLIPLEAGFIPTPERPTVADFLEYVRQEIGGDKVYSDFDSDRVSDLQISKQMKQDLDRLGVADAKTEREVMQRLEVGGGDGTRFALADLAVRNDAVLLDDVGPNDPHPGRMLALHVTRANFDAFDPTKSKDFGVHFGTQPQSDVFSGLISSREQARVLPVVIDAKNVVDVPDLMMWPANEVAQAVEAKVPSAQGLAAEVAAAPGDAGKDALRKGLTSRGIDALRYWNESEGDGWSYIVWDKGHVTSATSPKDAMFVSGMQPKSDGQAMFSFSDEQIDKMPTTKAKYRLVGGPGDPPLIGEARAALKVMASHIGIVSEQSVEAARGAKFYAKRRELGSPLEAVKQANDNRISEKGNVETMRREATGQSFNYDIEDVDGNRVGRAYGWVVGKEMYFDWLGGWSDEKNTLGIRVIKDLREQVRKDFPQVTKFTGYRVSGARSKADANNKIQSVTMFAFAGERAKTADLEALAKAKKMTEDGKDRTDIWTSTGWFKGVDGKWRFEIDDSSMSLNLPIATRSTMGKAINHPEFFAAYPFFKDHGKGYYDISPKFNYLSPKSRILSGGEGVYRGHWDGIGLDRTLDPANKRSTTLHEMQHAVQDVEEFVLGASPSDKEGLTKISAARRKEVEGAIRIGEAAEKHPDDYTPEEWAIEAARVGKSLGVSDRSIKLASNWNDARAAYQEYRRSDPYARYHDNAGEVEARLVETRRDMTADERRARPPWLDYDVPEDQQIVRFGAGQQNSEPMFALADRDTGQSMRRDQDALGYYSQLDRVLKSFKPTDSVTLDTLAKRGVKTAELEARGLKDAFAGGPVKVGDLQANAGKPVRLNEVVRGRDQTQTFDEWRRESDYAEAAGYNRSLTASQLREARAAYEHESPDDTKWSRHSLDPSNPSYRETVLHLPVSRLDTFEQFRDAYLKRFPGTSDGYMRAAYAQGERAPPRVGYGTAPPDVFQSGHFPEPNITGHLMTSMTRHEGKPVFTVDQIQSDWGQRLRDGGVRDEAKIAGLKARLDEANAAEDKLKPAFADRGQELGLLASLENYGGNLDRMKAEKYSNGKPVHPLAGLLTDEYVKAMQYRKLLWAELNTAEASASGHPLVNTTDQWTNTTLRRAIRMAAEADAEYIAIPHGDTVLSYNPGKDEGMAGFYGTRTMEGIVPKNLRKMLEKLDKESPRPQRVETLATPSGDRGWQDGTSNPFDKSQTGFTVFPLTEKVKASVREEGQALFAMRDERGREKLGAAERAAQLKADLAEIETRFQASGGDEREKLQAKRAVLLNARALEKVLDDIELFRGFAGKFDGTLVSDNARALLVMLEGYGSVNDVPFKDMHFLHKDIVNAMLQRMSNVGWEFRKGAITGDMRRRAMRTSMDNMIKEAAGENTGDPLAKALGKEWLAVQEHLRQRFNAAGGDIPKLEGYFAPQGHDPEMLLMVGQRKWVDYLMAEGMLDRDRMIDYSTGKPFEDAALRDVLSDIWKTVTTAGGNKLDPDNPVMIGKGAMYKRHMDHRVIHFKGADNWLKYQRELGNGDVFAAMHNHINVMARDIAAMERFGANPNLVYQRAKAIIKNEAEMHRSNKIVMDEFADVVRQAWTALQSANRKVLDDAGLLPGLAKSLDELRAMKDSPGAPVRQVVRDAAFAKMEANLAEFEKVFAQLDGKPASGPLVAKGRDLMRDIRNQAGTASVLDKKKSPTSYVDGVLHRADEVWDSYMGVSNVAVNMTLARGLAGTRNIISSGLLVMAPISSVTDFSTQLAARRFSGIPANTQLRSFINAFKSSTKQEMLRAGVGHEVAMAAFQEQALSVDRFSAHQVTGYIADRSHQFSFLSPLTAAQKAGYSHDFMSHMGSLVGVPFDKLDAETQRMFKRHGISRTDWMRLSKVEPDMSSGVPMMTRTVIEDQFGTGLAEKYGIMHLRERAFSTIETGNRARSMWIGNTKPGTRRGELARSEAMFKSFPTMYTMLILGRLYGEMMNGRWGSAAAYGGTVFVFGSILGATAIQLKNLWYGRDPEDMTKPKFWAHAFAQSGGLGLPSDYINSAVDRNQNSMDGLVLGPVYGAGKMVMNATLGNLGQYGREEKTNIGREFVKAARSYTPGMFVPFYLRSAYNHMILDQVQNYVDPDAHKARRADERARKKNFGNGYYWPAGQMFPPRAPNIGAAIGRN